MGVSFQFISKFWTKTLKTNVKFLILKVFDKYDKTFDIGSNIL